MCLDISIVDNPVPHSSVPTSAISLSFILFFRYGEDSCQGKLWLLALPPLCLCHLICHERNVFSHFLCTHDLCFPTYSFFRRKPPTLFSRALYHRCYRLLPDFRVAPYGWLGFFLHRPSLLSDVCSRASMMDLDLSLRLSFVRGDRTLRLSTRCAFPTVGSGQVFSWNYDRRLLILFGLLTPRSA